MKARVIFELTFVSFIHIIKRFATVEPPPVVIHVVKRNTNHEASGIEVFQRKFSEDQNCREDFEQSNIIFFGKVEI